MKKYLFIFMLIGLNDLVAQPNTPNYETAKDKAKSIFYSLKTADYAQLNSYFSADFSKKLPVNELEKTFKKFAERYGQADSLLAFQIRVTAEASYYEQAVQFENEKMDIIFTLNENGELTALRIAPYTDKTEWQAPTYVKQEKFKEQSIEIGEELPLLGKFTAPNHATKLVVVVMVHGSGPNDMNESLGPNKLFKDLAYGLASNNISSIRYNKRSYDYKNSIAKRANKITIDEVVTDDAVKAIAKAKALGAEKIILLGHSLGAHMAPKIAAKAHVDGVILMAGNASPLQEVILPQITHIMENDPSAINEMQYNQLKWQLENLEKGNYDSTTVGPILPFGLSGVFWISMQNYEPQKISKKQDIPYLVLNGGRDYQVTPKEAKKWKNGSRHQYSKTIIYPSLNHMFFAGEGIILPAEYQKVGHLHEEVLTDISSWINNL